MRRSSALAILISPCEPDARCGRGFSTEWNGITTVYGSLRTTAAGDCSSQMLMQSDRSHCRGEPRARPTAAGAKGNRGIRSPPGDVRLAVHDAAECAVNAATWTV